MRLNLIKLAAVSGLLLSASFKTETKKDRFAFSEENAAKKCIAQLNQSVPKMQDLTKHPRLIETGEKEWKQVPDDKLIWTSGFYPGVLWYAYEYTGDEKWKNEAIKRTEVYEDFQYITEHHDIGFMMFPAYGNGIRLANKPEYAQIYIPLQTLLLHVSMKM